MWIEIFVKKEMGDVDWDAIGKKPKKGTVEYSYTARMVWMENILWVETHEDGAIIQLDYDASPIIISNDYNDLKRILQECEQAEEESAET